ncbi:hypothetical protein SS50377_22378 [Spironucleus salmonicida]|uniref:Uncharacterized protein n=1 Tax=Spironucleus salmonicida TaxID=348837 RepID=V6LCC9_9EUKA|nr:hypothetical protein SS50377_22378 [Spironucleus salmonicida]|eukprot:EST42127.1 Hypothetical protein SS50377_18435 [Spironucleus salmonicida]
MNFKNQILKKVFSYVLQDLKINELSETQFDYYLSNRMDWKQASAYLKYDFNKLKRWYNETYLRCKLIPLSTQDSKLMRIMVFELLDNGCIWDKSYKQLIQSKLSRSYDKITFNIAFNNQIKSWKRLIPDRLLKDLLALNIIDLNKTPQELQDDSDNVY